MYDRPEDFVIKDLQDQAVIEAVDEIIQGSDHVEADKDSIYYEEEEQVEE